MWLYETFVLLDELNDLARDIANLAKMGDIITISGDVGTGKTTLARHIIRNFCDSTVLQVTSPTFNVCRVYDTNGKTVYHFDLYRLKSPSELIECGFEEALENGLVIVEWPDMIMEINNKINVCLKFADYTNSGRLISIEIPSGKKGKIPDSS